MERSQDRCVLLREGGYGGFVVGLCWAYGGLVVGIWWACGGLVLGLWWHGVGLWWAYEGLVVGLGWAYGVMGYGIHTVGCVVCLCVCGIMGRGVWL